MAEQETVVGFLAGALDTQGVRKPIAWQQLAWPLLRGILLRPTLLLKVLVRSLQGLLHGSTRRTRCAGSCEIGPVAVSPHRRGTGVGGAPGGRLPPLGRQRGVTTVFLNTDPRNSDAARLDRFYQRLGFRPVRSIPASAGRVLTEYTLSLRSAEPPQVVVLDAGDGAGG